MKEIERFSRGYFNNLKTMKEKEEYFIKFIQKSLGIMEKGGNPYGD